MILYFMAIPRTGGTTLHQLLYEHYGPEITQYQMSIGQLMTQSAATLNIWRVYAGHFYMSFENLHDWDEPITYITMLRDPVLRTISQFKFGRATGRIPQEQDLLDFVTDERMAIVLRDYQARSFLIDDFDEYRRLQNVQVVPMDNYRYVKTWPDDEGVHAQAIEALSKFSFVGITDFYQTSLRHLEAKGLLPYPWGGIPHRNHLSLPDYTSTNERMNEALKIIKKLTPIDQQIYDYYRNKLIAEGGHLL